MDNGEAEMKEFEHNNKQRIQRKSCFLKPSFNQFAKPITRIIKKIKDKKLSIYGDKINDITSKLAPDTKEI